MAHERRSDRTGTWADALAVALEFVPEEAGLIVLAAVAAGFLLLVIGWAMSLIWENLKWL